MLKDKSLFLFIAIFILGCFLRLYKFTTIPFGLNHDASLNGLAAIDLWQKLPQYTPYYAGWVGETLYHYWLGLNFFILGISPATLKLASIIIGIITLPFFYKLAKNLQGKTTALFSLFFLAISGWHITMSKVGWLAILVPLFQSITFIFLYKALKNNNKWHWIGAGISLAITLNSYGAARITPLIIVTTVIFWYIKKLKLIKKFYANLAYFLIAFSITILPLFTFAIKNWNTYNGRAEYLSVTNKIKETNSLNPLFENIKTSIGMLHYRANGDDFFVNEPLLEKIPGLLFIIGLLYIILTIKKFESFTIFIWLSLGFLPGILSVPNGNHNFSILIPAYLIIGQGANTIWGLTKKMPKNTFKIGYLLVILILVISFMDVYRQYISKERREIFGFYPEATVVANYMKTNRNNYDFYLTDNFPRDILTFTTYKKGNPFKQHYIWFQNGSDFLTVRKENKSLAFLMFANEQNERLATQLLSIFPGARKNYLFYKNDLVNRKASLVVVAP